VRAFADSLDAALDLPMLLWDERLSTFAAQQAADQAGLRGEKRTAALDALAAAAILQDTLDAVARTERRGLYREP
jgi:putative Holliday junction resolvase